MIDVMNEFDNIRGNLWLGGIPRDIQQTPKGPKGGFKFIFNFSGKASYYIAIGQRTIICPFNDCDLIPNEIMLHDMADMVLEYEKRGPVLVHCAAGINRSALVMGLALIKDGMTAEDAIALMREKRSPTVLYNNTFANWLLAYDDKEKPKIWTPSN